VRVESKSSRPPLGRPLALDLILSIQPYLRDPSTCPTPHTPVMSLTRYPISTASSRKCQVRRPTLFDCLRSFPITLIVRSSDGFRRESPSLGLRETAESLIQHELLNSSSSLGVHPRMPKRAMDNAQLFAVRPSHVSVSPYDGLTDETSRLVH
jgi:hypothetical protein